MAALTQGRQTKARSVNMRARFGRGMAASVTIFEGSIVAMDTSGNLRPGRATATDIVVGVARDGYVNGTTAGATIAECDCGVFAFDSGTAGDAITIANKGATVYVIDDQTVGLTNGTNTRPAAGKVHDVTADGVWVAIGLPESV